MKGLQKDNWLFIHKLPEISSSTIFTIFLPYFTKGLHQVHLRQLHGCSPPQPAAPQRAEKPTSAARTWCRPGVGDWKGHEDGKWAALHLMVCDNVKFCLYECVHLNLRHIEKQVRKTNHHSMLMQNKENADSTCSNQPSVVILKMLTVDCD